MRGLCRCGRKMILALTDSALHKGSDFMAKKAAKKKAKK
jgi:hypothetical protein